MEFDLMTSGGIATITMIIIEYIKRKMEFNPDSRWYSLIFITMGLAIAFILAMVSIPVFEVDFQSACQNGLIGWVTATFGFQLIKGSTKAIIKK